MITSIQGRVMIEGFEGLRTVAYLDSVGIPTLGYGHTSGVKEGDTCSPIQADLWLSQDLKIAEHCVSSCVKVPLAQNQFDALVSFTFNLGCGVLERSLLLELLNAGNAKGSADQFLNFCHAGGKQIPGLYNRRVRERQVFLNGFTLGT